MMSCREVYGFLDDFLEGRLDVLTRLTFGAHLLLCSKCRKYLATYRTALDVARNVERTDAPPDEIPEELVQAILSSRAADPLSQPQD